MGMKGSEIEAMIRAAFPDAEVEMTDLAGDDNHWAATVRSAAFRGKSRVAQHRLVYDALHDFVARGLHALAIEVL